MIQSVCLDTGYERTLPNSTATKSAAFMEWVNAYCKGCNDHHMMAVKNGN